jgi:hypothetical protein
MTLRIGDKVVIASDDYRHKPSGDLLSARAVVTDIKWNMTQVRYTDGHIEWIESKRVYLQDVRL